MGVYRRVRNGKVSKTFYMDFVVNGERIFKNTGCTVRKDALRVMHEAQRQAEEAPSSSSLDVLLSEAIEQAYDSRWSRTRDGLQTLKRLKYIVELCGDVPLKQVDATYLRVLQQKLFALGRKQATVNGYLANLKTLLNVACDEWEVLDRVPKIRVVPVKNGRTRVITPEEEAAITSHLRAVRGPRRDHFPAMADVIEVLVDTGMRVSECLSLRYGRHVDFESGCIRLTPDITKDSEERTIPMTGRVSSILLRRQPNYSNRPFPYTSDQLSHAWDVAKKALGLEEDKEFVRHALRHTFASRLIDNGVPLYTVQKLLGHSSISVTERYSHLNPGQFLEAIASLEGRENRRD